jgi:Na+/serine symporter
MQNALQTNPHGQSHIAAAKHKHTAGMQRLRHAAQMMAHLQRQCCTSLSPAAITSALGCFSAAIAAVIASLLLPAPFSSTQ